MDARPRILRAWTRQIVWAVFVGCCVSSFATPPVGAAQPQAEQESPEAPAEPATEHPFPGRIQSPGLEGGSDWINVAGPLNLKALRGKFVLLDFWTYCCINCMHVLPELKKLEHAFPNELVVIGVHSAKFETEKDSQNITDAVLRYEIEHPVVNDARHTIWNKFRVSSWPSLRVIDPEGYLVGGHSGEIEFEVLERFFNSVIPFYREKGLLDETPVRFDLERYQAQPTPLSFPGKVLADEPGNRLFIADSNHNRIVVTRLDGTLLTIIGSGQIGAADGGYADAQFDHPQGMVLNGDTLYVADTENHLLRKIDLDKQQVTTIAGVGIQGRNAWPGLVRPTPGDPAGATLPERFVGPPLETPINSPWALWIHGPEMYIAMAGPHQIWKMPLDESEIGPYAGNGREDIVDGRLLPPQPYEAGYSSFAQPSGLASDGEWLYVADSEGSSIRAVPFDPDKEVRTLIGTAHLQFNRLFSFGDVDGQPAEALLQHVLGVTYYRDQLYIADTYNNKVKVVDPASGAVTTIAGNGQPGTSDQPPRFDEPAGITAAAGKLYLADTNSHLIRTIDLDADYRVATLDISGLEPPRPAAEADIPLDPQARQITLKASPIDPAENQLQLAVTLNLPEGYKINPAAPMGYRLQAAGDQGPLDRTKVDKWTKLAEPSREFRVRLPLTGNSGSDEFQFALTYYYCQDGAEGLCKVGTAVWTIPIELSAEADGNEVALSLEVE